MSLSLLPWPLMYISDDNHMPQDDLEDAGALDLDHNDTEYKLPYLPLKKNKARFNSSMDEDTDENSTGIDPSGEISAIDANGNPVPKSDAQQDENTVKEGSGPNEKWQPKWQVIKDDFYPIISGHS